MGTIKRLDQWMKSNHPNYKNWESGSSKKEIDQFEEKVGHELPQILKELLAWRSEANIYSGYEVSTCEDLFEYFEDMGEMADNDEWDGDSDHWHKGWIPFLMFDSECFLIDPLGSFGGQPGQIIHFDHEGSEKKHIVAPSIEAWLEAFVIGLEEGVFAIEDADDPDIAMVVEADSIESDDDDDDDEDDYVDIDSDEDDDDDDEDDSFEAFSALIRRVAPGFPKWVKP